MSREELKEEVHNQESGIEFIDDLKENGSRVSGYIDKRNGKAHFMTFDKDGKMIRSVHGHIR